MDKNKEEIENEGYNFKDGVEAIEKIIDEEEILNKDYKLKKKVICELMIITCSLAIMLFCVLEIILPNIYFSNFWLSAICLIFAGIALIFIFPLYVHDYELLDIGNATKKIKLFWSYCIRISILICIISMISLVILYLLVILLNLISTILNAIATILIISIIVSFVISSIATIINITS